MAAIGSKRQRFVGDGNDGMVVTSLVRSLVELPYLSDTGTHRAHPSPGSVGSSRLVVQRDVSGTHCVAFCASGGGVWRHAVPFSGGEVVAYGKEAMLKPTTVTNGSTQRCRSVRHGAEIQSLALHDPVDDGSDEVRLGSADCTGKTLVTWARRDGCDAGAGEASHSKQWVLQAPTDTNTPPSVSGWTGVCFHHPSPNTVAVARHFPKTLDVFDGDALVRRMRTPLLPRAVTYVEVGTRGTYVDTDDDVSITRTSPGSKQPNNPLLAVAEGNALSLWDVRQGERGGCVKRVTLCNRGQSLYSVAAGVSQGSEGGGRVKLPKLNNGDPLIATAGAERSVHVLDVDRCSVVKRWPSAMKFDITRLSLSKSSPDHVYVAGLDNELLCGCWSRGALAGGFAFRGDSRWLGMDSTSWGGGGSILAGGETGAGIVVRGDTRQNQRDVVAGWCESGHLFAARVERVRNGTKEEEPEEEERRRKK